MKKAQCQKCGYEWVIRIASPKACPSCKQYGWKKELKKKKVVDVK